MAETASSTTPALTELIQVLNLSTRVLGSLRGEGVETIGQLAALRDADLLRIPNFGRVSLAEVKACLAGIGASLADAPAPHRVFDILDGDTRVTLTMPELMSCVVAAVEKLCREKVSQKILSESAASREERDRAIWQAWRAGGVTQPEIGRRFSMSTPAVNIIIRKFWTDEVLPTLTPEQQHHARTWGTTISLG